MKKGFIYILSNNSLKSDLLKIGKKTKKTTDRSKQLSASTSIPENFKVEDEFEFADLNWAEKEIHNSLSKYRYNKKREFFTCDFKVAKQVIVETQIKK
ncbi:GIY-YIG nuclease family protein [Bizionia sp.]|uniref:GIY-YIG nuclease family protein n=1 Tax=Bizionia sp. TaxID=1954480 RepID=UPI003A8D228D